MGERVRRQRALYAALVLLQYAEIPTHQPQLADAGFNDAADLRISDVRPSAGNASPQRVGFIERDTSCKGVCPGHHIPDNAPVRNAKAPNKSGLLRLIIGFTSREPNAL